jgi:WS/DGAT/MGAT family acyltransferase
MPRGVRRLRPDDHFMVLMETDATPMHVGALLMLDASDGRQADAYVRLRSHLAERLPLTPLMAVLHQSPDGYDSDVRADVADCDLDRHIRQVSTPLDDEAVLAWVADASMRRLDLSRPPFEIAVLDRVAGGRVAVHVKMHHAVADGIGFQTVLGLLSDAVPPAAGPPIAAVLPDSDTWRRLADARFEAEAGLRAAHKVAADAALAVLKGGTLPPRALTPVLKLSGPPSSRRAFATVSLPLTRVRALGKALGGTVNDIFLALASTAIRTTLVALDDLPPDPIVVNSARSYRRPEHGAFGNRIVAMHPHLATHLPDPIGRLRAIQDAMAGERARTPFDEALLDAPERPFGARDRRARFADRSAGGAAVLPGNVTLSNVPGPAEPRSFAGMSQLSNHPTPLLGAGRFLNITSRRNEDRLDMGVMTDAEKLADPGAIAAQMLIALSDLERIAGR